MFALATRVQWERDTIRVSGLQGSLMDPSIARGAKTVQKVGIDATLAPSEVHGAPQPVPPRVSVKSEALENAAKLLNNERSSNWPEL